MIMIKQLGFSYGRKKVLNNISCSAGPGEFLSVLGMNGAGKSTLLKAVAGLIKPVDGEIFINNRPLKQLSRQELAKTIAYLPQNSLPMDCTVFEAVLIGRKPYLGWGISKDDLEEITHLLDLTCLTGLAERPVRQLSGGEMQRVAIARTLAQRPSVLLLDEPVNHLDIRSQIELLTLVHKLAKELGIAIIAVLHDLNLALRFSDSFVVLQNGELLVSGGQGILTCEVIEQAYQLEVTMLEQDGVPLVVPVIR